MLGEMMNKSLAWLSMGLITLSMVACNDDGSSSLAEDQAATRAFTTEVTTATISGTWTTAGSPYYVPEDLLIPADQSLVIEPGVDVWMGREASLLVEGTLLAEGLLGESIRFMSIVADEDYGLWQSIVFRPTAGESKMSYCLVAFGSKFNNQIAEKNAAIVVDDCSPRFEHNLIWMNQYNGFTLLHAAMPTLRSNIVFENDGSGIAFDTSHVANYEQMDWVTDSLIFNNNVSSNSSLPFRFTTILSAMQWGEAFGDTVIVNDQLAFGNDVLGEDADGNDVFRRNENNDKVDAYGNSIVNAMFDEISEDFQSFNSCSPCIQSAFDYEGADRADQGLTVYAEAPNELRKRLKTTDLGNAVYTVTCDAFSHEPVTMQGSTVEFAGYYGLNFDGGLDVENTSFEPTADRQLLASWKSVVVDGNAGGTARFNQVDFALGSESSFSGQDWINAGGMLELRNGAVAEVEDCTFDRATAHAVSAHGAGTMVSVESSLFTNTGLSAYVLIHGARGKLASSELRGCGSYGVFLYTTGYFTQIENNLIVDGDLYGIKLQDVGAVEILQNTIAGNAYGGVKLESNSNPLMRYNLIANNDFAISDYATGIVGNQLGIDNDTNNPDINVNWFFGNGGNDSLDMPSNWYYGACNVYETASFTGDYVFSNSLTDCENEEVPVAVGWTEGAVSNAGPMLGSIGDLSILEDDFVELYLGAISFGGDEAFDFTVECDQASVTVDLDGNHLLLVPDENWFGEASITVTVTNSEGSDSESSLLTVASVNDAPVIDSIEDAQIAMYQIFILEVFASDVEDDDIELSADFFVIDGDEDGNELELNDETLTFTPGEDWTGTVQITVTATDGDLEDRESFILTVGGE
jgi:hypothetical protein